MNPSAVCCAAVQATTGLTRPVNVRSVAVSAGLQTSTSYCSRASPSGTEPVGSTRSPPMRVRRTRIIVSSLLPSRVPAMRTGAKRCSARPSMSRRDSVAVCTVWNRPTQRDARRGFGPANVVIKRSTPDAESGRASQGQVAAVMVRSLH